MNNFINLFRMKSDYLNFEHKNIIFGYRFSKITLLNNHFNDLNIPSLSYKIQHLRMIIRFLIKLINKIKQQITKTSFLNTIIVMMLSNMQI